MKMAGNESRFNIWERSMTLSIFRLSNFSISRIVKFQIGNFKLTIPLNLERLN